MKAYGCVKCQKHHAERDRDCLYEKHLMHQSKHGIYHLSERDWAFGTLLLSMNLKTGEREQP